LAAASMSPQFSLTYRGTVEINGRSAHDIEVLRVVPGSERIRYREGLTVHLFVDASTWQVVMMQDVDPRNQIRQIQYSDYGAVNGALIPFAISEQIANRQTWAIQLSQVSFNTGLQDSDFQL
jgi:outer membrane lipoprotein-sorting protein